MLLVEVIEMLWLLHVGACDACGCESGEVLATCAWVSIGLL